MAGDDKNSILFLNLGQPVLDLLTKITTEMKFSVVYEDFDILKATNLFNQMLKSEELEILPFSCVGNLIYRIKHGESGCVTTSTGTGR